MLWCWPTPLLPVAWITATESYSRLVPDTSALYSRWWMPWHAWLSRRGCGTALRRLFVTLAPGSRTNRLQALSSSVQVSSPARRPVPRVDDRSNFGSVNASPPTVCRSRWPCSTEDQNCQLRSSKFLSRWSVTVEYSAVWHETVVSIYCTVLQPAKDSHVRLQLLRMSAAVIILDY